MPKTTIDELIATIELVRELREGVADQARIIAAMLGTIDRLQRRVEALEQPSSHTPA